MQFTTEAMKKLPSSMMKEREVTVRVPEVLYRELGKLAEVLSDGEPPDEVVTIDGVATLFVLAPLVARSPHEEYERALRQYCIGVRPVLRALSAVSDYLCSGPYRRPEDKLLDAIFGCDEMPDGDEEDAIDSAAE